MRGTVVKTRGEGIDHTDGGLECLTPYPIIGRSHVFMWMDRPGKGMITSNVTEIRDMPEGFEIDTLNSTYKFTREEIDW